ncbi:MAG TPA: O-antigen ligase family protein [Acidimicrobiia bacterium]|jgi:O-antigen ligase
MRARLGHRLNPIDVLVFAAVFATGFLVPSFGPGFVIADVFILAIISVWVATIPRGEPRGVVPRVLPPLILIFIGSLFGTMEVGVKSWIVSDLIKDVGSFASFLAMVTILRFGDDTTMRAVGWGAGLSTIMVTVFLLLEAGTRAQGFFPNPNVAAHFLVTNLVVMTMAPLSRRFRYIVIGIGVAGLLAAGSFGSVIMAVGAFGYLLVTMSSVKRRQMIKKFGAAASVILALVLLSGSMQAATQGADLGFNERHFERSSEGRLARWTQAFQVAVEHPLGVGPGSNAGLGLLPGDQEAHNEFLAYLTERSLIGLIGLILLYLAIWRLGPRGGVTRALVIGFALQSLVRETLHYRHLWLLLAFALVLDETADEQQVGASATVALRHV